MRKGNGAGRPNNKLTKEEAVLYIHFARKLAPMDSAEAFNYLTNQITDQLSINEMKRLAKHEFSKIFQGQKLSDSADISQPGTPGPSETDQSEAESETDQSEAPKETPNKRKEKDIFESDEDDRENETVTKKKRVISVASIPDYLKSIAVSQILPSADIEVSVNLDPESITLDIKKKLSLIQTTLFTSNQLRFQIAYSLLTLAKKLGSKSKNGNIRGNKAFFDHIKTELNICER